MIEKLVYECIEQHKGGEKFFDALDDKIKNNEKMFGSLLGKSLSFGKSIDEITFITSGKFGKVYGEWLKKWNIKCVILEGALRENEINNPEQYKDVINHEYCVFIDDSYFAGRTYNKAKAMVTSLHGCMLGAVVAYDGSKEYHHEVISLFRYYDNFGLEE